MARIALTAAGAALGLVAAGCEKAERQADRRVDQIIAESQSVAMAEGNQAKAYQLLTQASQQAEASHAARAHAMTLLAQEDYSAAIKQMPELWDLQGKVGEAIDQIGQLGRQIVGKNLLIEQCKAADPAGVAPDKPLEAIEASRAKYTALADELGKKIVEAQKLVADKAQEVSGLERQQAAAANQAGALFEQSEKAQGPASLDLFRQSAEERAKADKLGVSVSRARAELSSLERTVQELKAQQKIAQAAAESEAKRAAEVTNAWEAAKKVIQQTAASSRQIATTELAAKARSLADAIKAADAKREEIDQRLQKAIGNFANAAQAADAVTANMRQRLNEAAQDSVERAAWSRMERLHNFTVYRLDKARALMTRGGMYVSHKALLESQLRLTQSLAPVLRQAGAAMPPQLNAAALNRQIAEATKTAKECFDDANILLEDIAGRGHPDDRSMALFPRVGVLYALYNLTGQAKHLSDARETLGQIAGAGGGDEEGGNVAKALPVLPPELEQGIVKRVAVDITAPPRGTGPTSPSGAPGSGKEMATWMKMMRRAFDPGGAAQPPQ